MFKMMESLEGRQMFSVALDGSTTLAAPDVAVDTAAPTGDAGSPTPDTSSAALYKACCTGKHISTGTIVVR